MKRYRKSKIRRVIKRWHEGHDQTPLEYSFDVAHAQRMLGYTGEYRRTHQPIINQSSDGKGDDAA
ncbi:MAG: hypothetical protein ABIZ81_09565 [Opitutaceae bacterium]